MKEADLTVKLNAGQNQSVVIEAIYRAKEYESKDIFFTVYNQRDEDKQFFFSVPKKELSKLLRVVSLLEDKPNEK